MAAASPSPIDFARDFVDYRAAKFHEAFAVESYFNKAMSKYESKDLSDLEQTLKRFQIEVPDQADFDFDLLKCTWKDVLQELERAQAAAFEDEKRGKKLHQKAWRGLGTVGDIFAPGLVGIPNNMPLCVLQGGLAVIFSLARHRAQDRDKILRAFEDIPSVIMMAYGKAESIPRDRPGCRRLYGVIGELQKTLLRTIPLLIDRLNPGTFIAKAMSPLRGFGIDELFGAVRSASEIVRICAEEIMDNIIVSSHETIHSNHKTSTQIHTIARQTGEEVGELQKKIDEILKQQKSFQTALDAVSVKNGLLSFLMGWLKTDQSETDKSSTKESSPSSEAGIPLTPKQLLGLMNVHHLEALDDEQLIIRRGHSINSDAIAHAATMFQTSQVQQLMQMPESGMVLVNGCSDRSQNTKISPVTHVCATLTHALRRSDAGNVVLAFFCGQHSSSNDDLMGPQGLMRSLVASLVLSLVQNDCIAESAPIWFSNCQGDFDQLSLVDICQLFFNLVELVPKQLTVYCVVDGISCYEIDVWKRDFDLMMECFDSIIANRAIAAVFKLLLTSPTLCRWLPNLMPHQRVSLRNTRTRGATNPESYIRTAFGE